MARIQITERQRKAYARMDIADKIMLSMIKQKMDNKLILDVYNGMYIPTKEEHGNAFNCGYTHVEIEEYIKEISK